MDFIFEIPSNLKDLEVPNSSDANKSSYCVNEILNIEHLSIANRENILYDFYLNIEQNDIKYILLHFDILYSFLLHWLQLEVKEKVQIIDILSLAINKLLMFNFDLQQKEQDQNMIKMYSYIILEIISIEENHEKMMDNLKKKKIIISFNGLYIKNYY